MMDCSGCREFLQ
ncbi:hypothetical protein DRW41_15525 [Neobacillus piezotolerans]|uniref:Uncharacterized protein n=1 Tax=Neobacillus piezotolerans TaxID=2259171 RepID=A0A3D8GP43_9BACI|nr:hypothetical protein DRW41_15525 [Neobacillus piezotolerans]